MELGNGNGRYSTLIMCRSYIGGGEGFNMHDEGDEGGNYIGHIGKERWGGVNW